MKLFFNDQKFTSKFTQCARRGTSINNSGHFDPWPLAAISVAFSDLLLIAIQIQEQTHQRNVLQVVSRSTSLIGTVLRDTNETKAVSTNIGLLTIVSDL